MRNCYNEVERALRAEADRMRAEVNQMLAEMPIFETKIVKSPCKCHKNYDEGADYVIKDVKFQGPATIVFWADGTKTVVKTRNGEKMDQEKGLAMAIVKKVSGNTREYYELFKHFCNNAGDKDNK